MWRTVKTLDCVNQKNPEIHGNPEIANPSEKPDVHEPTLELTSARQELIKVWPGQRERQRVEPSTYLPVFAAMIRVNPTKVALKSEDLKEYETAKVPLLLLLLLLLLCAPSTTKQSRIALLLIASLRHRCRDRRAGPPLQEGRPQAAPLALMPRRTERARCAGSRRGSAWG